MKAFIKAITYALQDLVLTNEDLAREFPEWSVEKIADKVGINNRHIAAENETSADLAQKATEKLFHEKPDVKKTLLILYFFVLKVLIISFPPRLA